LHEFDCATAYRCDREQRVVPSVWPIGAPVSRFSAPLDFAPDKCFQADAPRIASANGRFMVGNRFWKAAHSEAEQVITRIHS
jgi:hypothetical protein